jgi:UDP-N-acetylmuramoyl-tripeptide--D-alanyl-D-alanine ligase
MPFLIMDIAELYRLFCDSSGVYTDTRNSLENGLFFALSGPNFDANQFAQKALDQGARAAVISDISLAKSNSAMINVEKPLETLQQLAQYHRRQLKTTIIGLTGSNGKTTTKELIASVLASHFTITATKGNLNNHIGVPLTLLDITPETEMAIVEMGANHQGEIEHLCTIAAPDLGYITNFGKAHMEGFGGIEGIVKGKSELYHYLDKSQGIMICNGDDLQQVNLTQKLKRICFGTDSTNNYIIDYKVHDNTLILNTPEGILRSTLYGMYNLSNIAAAYAFGKYFKVPFEKIQKGIASYQATNNRSQSLQIGDTTVILDAYNANPSSMRAALEAFFKQFESNRILILGDMLELGTYKVQEHQAVFEWVAQQSFDHLYLVGSVFSQIETSSPKISCYPTTEIFLKKLDTKTLLSKNILIKGSRGLALERILEELKRE